MNVKRTAKLVFLAAAVSAATAGVAWGQGVGNLPWLPFQFETGVPPTGWVVADPTGLPIPVVLDPAGPTWRKHLTGPNGGPFFHPALGPPLPVTEVLVVAGNLPWTDWHEDVVHPDWAWVNPSILVNGLPPTNLTTVLSGGSLAFYFDPVAPGSIVTITKELIYNGLPGTGFYGTLSVIEYPTPEPAAAAMLGTAGLLLVRRRVRPRAW